MSFASTLKDELALKDAEYPKDELSALLKTAGNINISANKLQITFKSENSKIAQKVYKKINLYYNVKPQTSIYKSMKLKKSNVYSLTIKEKVSEILGDLCLLDGSNFKNIFRSEYRIKSYLAGCFMGSGSVNNPISSNYHLEMSFTDEEYALNVAKMANKISLNAKCIKRRNMYVVYIKKAQSVADFIAGIGASNSYLEFEDYRINRDFYNNDNRLSNCEIANSVRTNMAAIQQIDDINLIKDKVGLDKLDNDLQILANLRLSNQEDSLRELAVKFNEITKKDYTKSGINHMFVKIKNVAMTYKSVKK